MTDDSTLLGRYAAHRDEAAFAEIVRRQLPLVYSAALRRLGRDTHHADDFGEIGAIDGVSEDAARKRIDRALGKLRDLLRPHGIASTSTALAALRASRPVSAAPAGLLASVTGAALSTGSAAATGVATFMTPSGIRKVVADV